MRIYLKRLFKSVVMASAVLAVASVQTSCADLWGEQHPGTYYTNNGETIADYLEGKVENHGDYSYFIAILKEARLWGQMRTYGTYNCFAPDNAAIQRYIEERYHEAEEINNSKQKSIFESIETVLQHHEVCDTIAKTHIFNNLMFASDLNGNGVLQNPNLLDRYVVYNSYADSVRLYDDNNNIIKAKDGSDSISIRLKYLINMQASIIAADDTVQNGVVHRLDKVLRSSNQFLPGLMKENANLSIFYTGLVVTGLKDTLEQYYDDTYPEIPYEWTEQALRDNYEGVHTNPTSYETDYIAMPEKREFKFTMFCMPDTALATYSDYYTQMAGLDGIHNINDLRQYAEVVYPNGAGLPDTSRYSSLNKFLSYHILPCWLSYNQFNTSQKDITKNHKKWLEIDIEDFFETLLPHSIMRISTPAKTADSPLGIFINRKGTVKNGLEAEGIRIAETAEEYNLTGGVTNICVNGGYHYVNKLLTYDDYTRNEVLKCRMRIMACTLSPDFINSGGRGRLSGDPSNGGNAKLNAMVYAYKSGYCKNFQWVEDQTRFFVRYRNKTFGTLNGDEITVRGSYDIAFRLPPVPSDGNYEIRIWNNSMAGTSVQDRGIVQFYFHQGTPSDANDFWRNWNWIPEDIPVDLRLGGADARIGMVLDDDDRYNDMTETQKEQAIDANDRSMRNRGYMKAMDSYYSNNGDNPLRHDANCYRKIICNEYLEANTDYYIRMRQVWEEDGVLPFSFIEIVPKSIYEGNEDKH